MKKYIEDDCSNSINRAYFTYQIDESSSEAANYYLEEYKKTYPKLPSTDIFKKRYDQDSSELDTCLFLNKYFRMVETNKKVFNVQSEEYLYFFDSSTWRKEWILNENFEDNIILGSENRKYFKDIEDNNYFIEIDKLYKIEKDGEEKLISENFEEIFENVIRYDEDKEIKIKSQSEEVFYKAGRNRNPVIYELINTIENIVKEISIAKGLPHIYNKKENYEADDLMGIIANRLYEEGNIVYMISNDEDLDQNCTISNISVEEANEDISNVHKYNPITKRMNDSHGYKLLFTKIIAGDKSDNISNVLTPLFFNGKELHSRIVSKDSLIKKYTDIDINSYDDIERYKLEELKNINEKLMKKIIKERKEYTKSFSLKDKIKYYLKIFSRFQEKYTLLEIIEDEYKELLELDLLEEGEQKKLKINKLVAKIEEAYEDYILEELIENSLRRFDYNKKLIDVKEIPNYQELYNTYNKNTKESNIVEFRGETAERISKQYDIENFMLEENKDEILNILRLDSSVVNENVLDYLLKDIIGVSKKIIRTDDIEVKEMLDKYDNIEVDIYNYEELIEIGTKGIKSYVFVENGDITKKGISKMIKERAFFGEIETIAVNKSKEDNIDLKKSENKEIIIREKRDSLNINNNVLDIVIDEKTDIKKKFQEIYNKVIKKGVSLHITPNALKIIKKNKEAKKILEEFFLFYQINKSIILEGVVQANDKSINIEYKK